MLARNTESISPTGIKEGETVSVNFMCSLQFIPQHTVAWQSDQIDSVEQKCHGLLTKNKNFYSQHVVHIKIKNSNSEFCPLTNLISEVFILRLNHVNSSPEESLFANVCRSSHLEDKTLSPRPSQLSQAVF